MRGFLILFFGLLAHNGHAALPGALPPDTLRPTSSVRRLRYTYANDLFFRTDYYFTQGMTLALVHPALARSPVNHLLLRGPAGATRYHGITLRYDGFTPLRIQDAFIRVGDRPYAAYLYASFFRTSRAPLGHQRLTTAVEVGFIGPAAGGKQLQTSIHRITGNAEPRGWDYQIGPATVLGYRVAYERKLLTASRFAEVHGTTEASLSTLYTYASAGAQLRVGRLHPEQDDQWGGSTEPAAQHWRLHAQAAIEGRLVGYDATLQGGIFSRRDPYTLATSQIRRAVLRSSGGVVVGHGNCQLAATATWVTSEFAGSRSHRWGQLGLTVGF